MQPEFKKFEKSLDQILSILKLKKVFFYTRLSKIGKTPSGFLFVLRIQHVQWFSHNFVDILHHHSKTFLCV